MLPDAVTTAAAAAAALGVEVGQIANSLIFDADGEPLLVLTSGAHRVDTAKVAALVGRRRRQAGHARSSSASTPARRSAASPRSATRSRSAPWSTRPWPVRRGVGGRRHPARGLPDHLRRTGPDHRRHAGRGGVSGPRNRSDPKSAPRRAARSGTGVTLHVWRVPATRVPRALWRMAARPAPAPGACPGSGSPSCSAPAGSRIRPGRGPTSTRWAALLAWDDARRRPASTTAPWPGPWRRIARPYCRLDLRPAGQPRHAGPGSSPSRPDRDRRTAPGDRCSP